MKKFIGIAAAVLFVTVPQVASAQTITFEGQSNAIYGAPITRDGFVIGNPDGQEQHFHEVASTVFGLASNGTGVLLNDRDSQIFLQALGGGAFTLGSFDIAASFSNNPASSFTATGFLAGLLVGTTSGELGNFATFAGFGGNVDRVVFDGIGGGGGFELDNVVVNSAVPEPASWAMMLIGFGAIGASMRRRRRVPAMARQTA